MDAQIHIRTNFYIYHLLGDYDPTPKYIVTVKAAFTNGTNMTVRTIAQPT